MKIFWFVLQNSLVTTNYRTRPWREARQILKDKGFDKNEKIP